MKKVVIKITGKLFAPGNEDLIRELANVFSNYVAGGNKLAVVTGGGVTARSYIEMGRKLELNSAVLDLLGIESTRLNALFFASLLGSCGYLPIPRSIDEFMRAWATGKVVVLGGLQPGQSTNAVAAAIADIIGADLLINATDVDGVYDKDPKVYPDAHLLKVVTVDELERILAKQESKPGRYELLDKVALNIIRRSRIRTVFINAFKIEHIRRVLSGEKDVGSWVTLS
ncbi:MAG: UMP kinase [Desulfurococcales archaeon]|nr:UMP kinase [Desulfurococcales archaeon]